MFDGEETDPSLIGQSSAFLNEGPHFTHTQSADVRLAFKPAEIQFWARCLSPISVETNFRPTNASKSRGSRLDPSLSPGVHTHTYANSVIAVRYRQVQSALSLSREREERDARFRFEEARTASIARLPESRRRLARARQPVRSSIDRPSVRCGPSAKLGRHLRSRFRCSMCSAVRMD